MLNSLWIEIILQSVGERLVVTGARPRGTLYADFELLEDRWGRNFWTKDEIEVTPGFEPKLSGIAQETAKVPSCGRKRQ